MSEHRYIHSVEKDEVELERLKLQSDIYDPVSITQARLYMDIFKASFGLLISSHAVDEKKVRFLSTETSTGWKLEPNTPLVGR